MMPKNCRFDSWMTLCEYVIDLANEHPELPNLANELIDSAEEYEFKDADK